MPKTVKEIVSNPFTGEFAVEYSDDSTNSFNIADTVTAVTDPVTGVIENLGGGAISLRGVPYVENMTEANTRKWRRMLSRVQNGLGRGRVLLIGNSLSMGAGCGTGTVGCAGAYAKNYPHKLADRLTAKGCRASHKSILADQRCTVGVPMTYSTYDARVAFGTGWAPGIAATLGGTGFGFSGAVAGTLTLTETCTNFEVYHAQSISSGTMTVSVDAGAPLGTLSSTGGAVVVKTAFSAGASGSHAIKLNAAGNGNMFVPGIVAWDATNTAIDILQAGWFGGMTSNFTSNSVGWDAGKMMLSYGADLTIIQLMVNEVRNAKGVSVYQSELNTIVVNALAAGGDVLLLDDLPDGLNALSAQQPYIDAAKAVAIANGIPFASVNARYGSNFQVGSNLGFYYDSVHQLEIGYAHQADWMANLILSV